MIKRIVDLLGKVMQIDEVICLSDSQITLHWIGNKEGNYKQYVRNRTHEIRDNVGVGCWNFIERKDNVADIPSRV